MFADDTATDVLLLDHGAASVLLSSTDSSVTDVETPGADCVMVALLVRSRITSLAEVAIPFEEMLLLAVGLGMCLVILFVVAVFEGCSLTLLLLCGSCVDE